MAESIEIITAEDLMSYPGAGNPSEADARTYAELVNGLINEVWATPVDPIPYWVQIIALETAGRAARNPKGLQSWTRSVDDGQRTERPMDTAGRAGIYLFDADRLRLEGTNPRRRRRRFGTIRVDIGY